jgi:arginyl-tRNA synthetase
MTFDPKESIDFNGNTGPFIQYTYARIRSVLRKAEDDKMLIPALVPSVGLSVKERNLLKSLYLFPETIAEAGKNYSPAVIANYVYELAKDFNQFYHDHSILKEENVDVRNFRLMLSKKVSQVLESSLALMGIEVPERM